MAAKAEELVLKAAEAHQTLLEAHIDGFTQALHRMRNEWKPMIQALVGDLSKPEQHANLRQIQWLSQELRLQLESIGYYDWAKQFVTGYPDSVAYAMDSIEAVTKQGMTKYGKAMFQPELSPWADNSFKAIQELDLQALNELGNKAVREISKQLTLDVAVGVARKDMIAAVSEYIDKGLGPAEKYVDTAVRVYDRTVTATVWQEIGIKTFKYGGPKDKRNRDFCASRVGKLFTKEAILNWNNGQGLPAWPYLGGYRCRHYLIPIVEEPRLSDVGQDYSWVV